MMMREMGCKNWSGEGRNSSSTAPVAPPVHAMVHEIHVMLVDHDSDALIHTAKQLEICQYRVTVVELASAAISMLLSGKAKFDVVMANVNSPDLHGFKLLQHAVTMGIPVVLMSVDDNSFLAMRALESGAFLFIKKPATMEILKCLWQHVLREKARMVRERGMFLGANYNNAPVRAFELRDQVVRQRDIENPNIGGQMSMMKNNSRHKKKKGIRNGGSEDEEFELENEMMFPNNVRRKMCTEWTQELHAKFMDAVEQLGEGRCFPKEILELMNVPGLTRMQVASHLQKCRNDNWRSPEERKATVISEGRSEESKGSEAKPRRFGSKPLGGKAAVKSEEKGQGSKTPNKMKLNGASSSSGPCSNGTPGTNSSSNDFYFPYMDCLIQNLPPQASEMDKPDPPQARTSYNDDHQKNSTRSQWSNSETSNFDSEHSETKGRDDDE